ncbi:protein phosphatase 1 regulatory subunit 15B [Lampris incognitus]|uniref:protein phosphatase 1 regulatory subunit 15B n=1 Tax=Lampris incognitus TaxID=2546036 RepID=UPI0024B5163C|nr:protein phosphatase 1 regulatory subunit 15B [Lampris incognitus]
MATSTIESAKSLDRAVMERFGSGGMALLPWTKQLLSVLWEQLRLLIQIIYYSFMSVFQMFRFEVHLRITDEMGQSVQHMSSTTNPTESFLFSSLFDGDNRVMVGGSNPLSSFCADVNDAFPGGPTAEVLLSSLRADDLCCELVDDFVTRTTANKEDGIFVGHHPSWKMGFPGDWSIFVSSTDSSGTEDVCHKSTEEERGSPWSSEEDQNSGDFDSEESKALWESLSRSSDPYNPFFFSACLSTSTQMGKIKSKGDDSECVSAGETSEEFIGPHGLKFWGSRSDSESSWGSSDGSCPDLDKEESESLWEFFSSHTDPYNPMCFTACTVSNTTPQTAQISLSHSQEPQQASLSAPSSKPDIDAEEESSFLPSSSDDEEEQLWRSLSRNDDPYHPLNSRSLLQSSSTTVLPTPKPSSGPGSKTTVVHTKHRLPSQVKQCKEETVSTLRSRAVKPVLSEKRSKRHCHPDTMLVPWKRRGQKSGSPTEEKDRNTHKKVQFSPLVQVHVMRTWPFARQASRRGCWEEMARDRDRFQRRIQEIDQAIGHCFSQAHRERIRAYLDSTLK